MAPASTLRTACIICCIVLLYMGMTYRISLLAANEIAMKPTTISEEFFQADSKRGQMSRIEHDGYPVPEVDLATLPKWIQNYVKWHREMRQKFPGASLFTDPDAPGVLIRYCAIKCGGLHDRIGKLPWDLYLANQTGRVLLMYWCKPVAIENFLVPNSILDWTLPHAIPDVSDKLASGAEICSKRVYKWTDMFQDYHGDRPRDEFWTSLLDKGLERAISGEFKDIKILRHSILGRDDQFLLRMQALGESDEINWTPTFGQVFWLFFRPSPGVQKELDSVYAELELRSGQYSAVHCRVRHPKGAPPGVVLDAKAKVSGGADKAGLLWTGNSRQFAVEVATHALQCAHTRIGPSEPIYFYSDSEDLVRYISRELPVSNRSSIGGNEVDLAAFAAVKQQHLVSREVEAATLHIDRQPDFPPPSYYASFVDLLVAARARCIIAGVGNFATFAAKISGTACLSLHQTETWGDDGVKLSRAKECELR